MQPLLRVFRKTPLALGVALAVLGVAVWWLFVAAPGWGEPTATTRLNSVGAEVFFLTVPQWTRRGPPRLVVIRLDEPASRVPYHFSASAPMRDHAAPTPHTIDEWAQRLGAPIVFNSGQFDANFAYLGWLKSQGQWLNTQRQPTWMGFLVSAPHAGGAWARIVDLATPPERERDPRLWADAYDNVIQSMMLIDEQAQVRVRQSDLAACRTVVAQDRDGRMLIIATEGAVTLFDLAQWLPHSGLRVVRAMNLDGGIESQLAVRTQELNLTLYGQYGTGSHVFEARHMARYPIPAVIAVWPTKRAEPAAFAPLPAPTGAMP